MNEPISDILLYLLSFSIFVFLQALAINGVKEALSGKALRNDLTGKISYEGNVLYMMAPRFLEKYKFRQWSKPLWSCIRCMSSFWGAATYWPIVLLAFGFTFMEVLVFIGDVFILVTLNYWVYKKV